MLNVVDQAIVFSLIETVDDGGRRANRVIGQESVTELIYK